MSVQVEIMVNGQHVDTIHVVNKGPVNGKYLPGDKEGGDGVREYRWASHNGRGSVVHRRSDGIHTLVSKVMAQVQA